MENWKKTFGIIWSGQLASILSSSVVGYAIIFWMSIETGSAEVLALAEQLRVCCPNRCWARSSGSTSTDGIANAR